MFFPEVDLKPAGWRHPEMWIWVVAGAVLVLIGIAFLRSPFSGNTAAPPVVFYPFFPFGFGWFWGFFGIFFLFWIFRWVFWPWGRGWGWGYRRRYWRRYDRAVAILRERYAKGEITREQFDQMMQDLEKHERVPGNI